MDLPKDIVVGLGEIGMPLFKVLAKSFPIVGYDKRTDLIHARQAKQLQNEPTIFIHICIPFLDNFVGEIKKLVTKYKPQGIVVHSTIKPHTTETIQRDLKIPVIYSATRGVHKRMTKDLKRYTKFYSVYDWAPKAGWASKMYEKRMTDAGIKTKRMTSPLTLELAKIIVDTSYYAWLICYAQLTNMIAIKNKVNYDEMWSFSDEIHKFLGNRPKMFPGLIGGHCLMPNLELIQDDTLNLIKEINSDYANILKKRQA